MINKIKKIIKSKKGAGTTLLGFILVPLIAFFLAIAIDISAYFAVKAYLNNGLDAAGLAALNLSVSDTNRADKSLKVIIDSNDPNYYINNLRKTLANNFNIASVDYLLQDPITPILTFAPKLDLISGPITVGVIIDNDKDVNAEKEYNGGALSDSKSKTIDLVMDAKLNLPISGKVLSFLGLSDVYAVPLEIKNTIRGIRVQKPGELIY